MDTRTTTTPWTALRRALRTPLLASSLLLALGLAVAPPLHAQGLSGQDRKRARKMLEQLQEEIEKRYYDPTFRGLDLAALREEAAIAAENAPTEFHMFAMIAQYLLKLEDSHTVFYPPAYVAAVDYGFELQFVGDTCYIVKLDEESDGAAKGLSVGDEVATIKGREGTETLRTKPEKDPFLGKLIVLVDSRTASAAEMVARVVQLEGRGTVIGDRTAGAVMLSEFRELDVGFGRRWVYLAQITVGDVLMSDGNRLEKVGVTPDELIIPTGEDLAAGRDPVMARALELAGITMSADAAGRIYERKRR